MSLNKIRKTGNLFSLDSAAEEMHVPLKRSLINVLGDKYEEAVELFLSNVNKQDLTHVTIDEIKTYGFSIGAAKKVLGVVQFALTLYKLPSKKRAKINTPEAAYKELAYLQYETQEHFVVLFLNKNCEVIGSKTLFIGALDVAVVHPREIMREAIKLSSASILVAHCHVSGSPSPSNSDVEITEKLMAAGRLIGIPLADHLVIGDQKYVSLKEKGYV